MAVKDGKVRKTFTLSEDALSVLDGVADEDRSQFVSDALEYFSDYGSGGNYRKRRIKVRDGSVSEDVSDPVGFELVRLESVLVKLGSLDFTSYAPWVAFFNDSEVKEYSFLGDSFAGFFSEGDFVESYPADFPLRSFILAQVADRVSGLVDDDSSVGVFNYLGLSSDLRLKVFLSHVIRERVSFRVKDLLCVEWRGVGLGAEQDAGSAREREANKLEGEKGLL
jgi:hypothetical protein